MHGRGSSSGGGSTVVSEPGVDPASQVPSSRTAIDRRRPWLGSHRRKLAFSSSLAVGLAVLRCFGPEHPTLGVADIAEELDIARSTAFRYLATLVQLGYLEQDARHKYRLSAHGADFGITALDTIAFRSRAQPLIEQLREDTTLAASLAVLSDMEIVIVCHARSFRRGQTPMDTRTATGVRMPSHCTAMGKVLLASVPRDERTQHLSGAKLRSFTSRTITSKRRLAQQLNEVASHGFAVSDEEHEPGVMSIAVPVRLTSGEVIAAVALTVRGTDIRAGGLRNDHLAQLIRTAGEIALLAEGEGG